MRPDQKYTPKCRWCGAVKAQPPRMAGTGIVKGAIRYRCTNAECPRKGQVPWKLPEMEYPFGGRRRPPNRQEDDPGFENAVRILEDATE